MKLFFLACADHCIIDQQTNRVSLFNLTEEIVARSFPAVHQSLTVIGIARKEPGDDAKIPARVEILINEEVLVTAPVELAFGAGPMTRVILQFEGFPIIRPGALIVRFFVRDDLLGTWETPIIARDLQPVVDQPSDTGAGHRATEKLEPK